MEYVPVASYSLEILSPEVKLHKIHGSVSKVGRCGHVSSFLQCPCHSAPDIKYTNGGQVPSPLPCVPAEESYQDSSGYAREEPTFNWKRMGRGPHARRKRNRALRSPAALVADKWQIRATTSRNWRLAAGG